MVDLIFLLFYAGFFVVFTVIARLLLSSKPASSEESRQQKKAKLADASEVTSQTSSRTVNRRTLKNVDTTTKDDQSELDIILTRSFATGNIAPNFLDNPFFQQFIAKLRPSYKLPSRKHRYPKVPIPAEFERVSKSSKESCENADFLAFSSDGWTDVQSNSIVNFVVHTPKPFLFESVDASADAVDGNIERIPHKGDFIAGFLSEQVVKIGKHKVVAVVTDHTANMKNAWKKLAGEDPNYKEETFPWILFEGCKAHMLNLAARGILEKIDAADCLKHCLKEKYRRHTVKQRLS